MRDLETISTAITAAETGHLVFSTLHTNSSSDAIDRMIDVFPPHQQQQIRVQLSGVLEGIVAQHLLPMVNGGRIAAFEVLLANNAIRNLIREAKAFQIPSIIQTSKREGMMMMDDCILQYYSQGLIAPETAVAYEPKSDNSVIVRQNQGFTYVDLNNFQWKDDGNNHGEYRLYSGLNNYESNEDVEAKTNKAVKVNSGQITTYPFKIDDEINIATTHKQYYQLDMNQDADGDGESDIVVWYTLSGHGVYDQSPKDVRNNYYIYTMGNVTYSGVGHSDFSNNEDELKLYINTMIAAYSASVHEPSIYLKENADTDSNDITTLYATIDDAIEEEAANKADARLDGADSTQDVYFTVKDSNLVRNQIDEKTVVYLDFYIEDPQKNPNDETIGTGNDKIYLKKVDWDIYTLNNDGTENEQINNSKENSQLNKDPRDFFENNKTYKVKVPLSVLPEGANSIKIYAVGYSKIYQSQVSGGDKETTTAKAYKTFQIQRVGLADLD